MVTNSRPLSGHVIAVWACLVGLVCATTVVLVWAQAGPGSTLRHLYLVPTVWAAVRFGRDGGLATASMAILLDVPFLLADIETRGLDDDAVEGLVTIALLLIVGGLAGSLADRARRQLERYEAVLSFQRSIGAGRPLAEGLGLANWVLARVLRADAVEVVIRRDDDTYVGADGPRILEAGTAAAWIAAGGQRLYLRDAPAPRAPGRPRRICVVPLVAGCSMLGVAGAERAAEFSEDDQAALEALGVQVVLTLENARLKDELESKVKAATSRLAELDRTKSELVSVASHELRTPLTSVIGYSELLLTNRYDGQAQRFLTVIHSEAERLGRILDNLLDLARIEHGQRMELKPIPVEVRPRLEAQAERFRAAGAARRFSVATAGDVPRVLIDPDAMERILTNLVSNAVKYSPPGSTIRLVAAAVDRGLVEISVEDQGVGIPPEALPHVFDRYYRVPHGQGSAAGLGLGLAVVKSLVEAAGGTVRVESARGTGSRFTVSLPAVP